MATSKFKHEENANICRYIYNKSTIRVKTRFGYGAVIIIGLLQNIGVVALEISYNNGSFLGIVDLRTAQPYTNSNITVSFDDATQEIVIETAGFVGSIFASGYISESAN